MRYYILLCSIIIWIPLQSQDSSKVKKELERINNLILSSEHIEKIEGNKDIKILTTSNLTITQREALSLVIPKLYRNLKRFEDALSSGNIDEILIFSEKLIGDKNGIRIIEGQKKAANIPFTITKHTDNQIYNLNFNLKKLSEDIKTYRQTLLIRKSLNTTGSIKNVNKSVQQNTATTLDRMTTNEKNITIELQEAYEDSHEEIKELIKKNTKIEKNLENWKLITTGIGALASLLLTLNLFLFFRSKNNKSVNTQNPIIKNTKKTLEKIDPTPVYESTAKQMLSSTPVIASSAPAGKYFFGEVMVTAGPRKDFTNDPSEGDFGLGEDVVGLMTVRNSTYFWILDGTSDSNKIYTGANKREIFSSRLLAQSVGWNIQKVFKDYPFEANSKLLLLKALEQVEIEWNKRIKGIKESEKKSLIDKLLEVKSMQCSTTILLGNISLDGKLDVCQIGDSKLIATPSPLSPPKSKGRFFANLSLDSDHFLKIVFNDLEDAESLQFTAENIHTVIAMTDGISSNTESWLRVQKDIDFTNTQIREVLASRKENTQDDKAICIIQIKDI